MLVSLRLHECKQKTNKEKTGFVLYEKHAENNF